VPKTLLGQHLDDEDVLFRQAGSVEIDSPKSFEFSTDGERVGCCPVRFEVFPRALEMIIGEDSEAGPE
jgi:diacylglycerol kinase family enzyme